MEHLTESLGLNGLKVRGRGDLSVDVLSGWFRTVSVKLLHTMIRSREGPNPHNPHGVWRRASFRLEIIPLEKSSGKDKPRILGGSTASRPIDQARSFPENPYESDVVTIDTRSHHKIL
jgi:hypothetical protein